jgi:hypothetical protein
MKKKVIIIDGPWASGKSIVKCILDEHPELLACIHQEPILTAIIENKIPLSFENREDLNVYFQHRLKINDLINIKKNRKIWWWFRKNDKITLQFKHNPEFLSKEMQKVFQESFFTDQDILVAYISGLKKSYPIQVTDSSVTPVLMEDFSLLLPLKLNNFKYKVSSIIVIRNPFHILNDLSNRKQGSYYLNYVVGFINGNFSRINIFYLLWFVRRFFYKDVLLLSFNNLVCPTNNTIDKVVDFLNIKHIQKLKKCTYHGEEIKSDSGVRYMNEVCDKQESILTQYSDILLMFFPILFFTLLTMPFFIIRSVFSNKPM